MSSSDELVQRSRWLRLAVIHALQLPALGLALFGTPPASLWVAGIYASIVCCLGTDSGWRWINRMLVLEAALWLALPLCTL